MRNVAKLYNKIAYQYAQKISKRLRHKEIEKFISYLQPQNTVLDIGSAAGRDSRYFKDRKFNIIGIDASVKLLKIAKKNNPDIEFLLADMRHLPFSDGYFHGIWANAIFHHLDKKDMINTIYEWKRVLKDKGILYLRTKMGKGVWKGRDELSVGEERIFTLLSKNQLSEMFQKVGFSEISLEVKKDHSRDINWLSGFFR